MTNTAWNSILRELCLDNFEELLPEMTRRNVAMIEVPRSATVVVGMRRTGKTFLLYQRMKELLDAGVPRTRMLHINFEDDRLLGMSVQELRLIPEIFYELYPENREQLCYFFLDEIQNIAHWESFVRRMVDTPNVQIYLSGSSAKLLAKELATAMRGRAVEIENLPLSFEEFLLHHRYFQEIPSRVSSSVRSKLQNALEKYFTIGGMPGVQDVPDSMRSSMLQGYVDSVIYRDVAERYNIANTQTLKFIMQMIFNNPARPFSVRKIADYLKSQQINTSREYTADYIDYLADSYLLHKVSLYSESAAKRRVNPDKFYLNDVGIIRAMRIKHALDVEPLLENLIYLELRRRGYKVEYVLTQDNSEVDFIAYHPMQDDYQLLQVCLDLSNQETLEREVSALQEAGDNLKIAKRSVITWNDEMTLAGNIQVIPAWKFLLEKLQAE